jgi:putative ABC transport system ATP-binding protein
MTSIASNAVMGHRESSPSSEGVVEVDRLVFSYPNPGRKPPSPVLHIDTLKLLHGERLFIYGPSGCGKTTLLGLFAGVLEPDSGAIRILGEDLGQMSRASRDAFRAAHIGYIFQMFNLLPYLSVLDNILLPTSINHKRKSKIKQAPKEAAVALAESLGLRDQLHAKSSELSVGQQQRVAAARALIGSPELVIADEPTSALDTDNRREFLDLLFEQCRAVSASLIFVSHDRGLQNMFDRSLDLSEINQAVKR